MLCLCVFSRVVCESVSGLLAETGKERGEEERQDREGLDVSMGGRYGEEMNEDFNLLILGVDLQV